VLLPRCGREHAVPDRVQDLHHGRDHDQRALARAWFEAQGGTDVARHFAALTTNLAAAGAFGITTTFGFWDWVGGRYSLWSAIGLPMAIAIGAARASATAGRRPCHGPSTFRHRAAGANLPVRLGLLDVWYRNFHGFTSRRWRRTTRGCALPAYLQQLEMESNGKRVDLAGEPLPYRHLARWCGASPAPTASTPISRCCTRAPTWCRWSSSPCARPGIHLPGHQPMLLANALAQAQALMQGKAMPVGHRTSPATGPAPSCCWTR
jgi:glucose-6-phosphate isomerase